eukprot:101907-Rhodomonas_salina.1
MKRENERQSRKRQGATQRKAKEDRKEGAQHSRHASRRAKASHRAKPTSVGPDLCRGWLPCMLVAWMSAPACCLCQYRTSHSKS